MTDKRDEIILQMEKMEKAIAETILQKNVVDRFKRYSTELSTFLSQGFKVVTGSTQKEILQQLYDMIKHTEGFWNDAVLLFKQGRYATPCFLSIICIEECAKISFGEWQFYGLTMNSKTSVKNRQSSARARGRNPLKSHIRKHFVAACSGALVNSRMDRILGIGKIDAFISDCETGQLERLRQSCLYTDIDQREHRVLLPIEQIDREKALFYICLAGELLAQVAGVDFSIGEGYLSKVDRFEKENGINPDT